MAPILPLSALLKIGLKINLGQFCYITNHVAFLNDFDDFFGVF